MGHPHITIVMIGPSLMTFCQTSGLGKEVLLNIFPFTRSHSIRFLLMGIPKNKVYATKPAILANLREAIEHVVKYQGKCFMMCAIPLLDVVSSVCIKMGISLRTDIEKNNKLSFVNIFTHLK